MLRPIQRLLVACLLLVFPAGCADTEPQDRAKGRRIPTNDLWIAAHAMETGADLVSAAHHFEHVDGIAWIRLKGERRPTWPTV